MQKGLLIYPEKFMSSWKIYVNSFFQLVARKFQAFFTYLSCIFKKFRTQTMNLLCFHCLSNTLGNFDLSSTSVSLNID